eukprot:Nk52_evm31s1810 gene=Nk52_evmTU31s1810
MEHTKGLAWLTESKNAVMDSKVWQKLTKDLYEAVQLQLMENHTMFFTDLKDREKIVVMDRAAKMAKNSKAFRDTAALMSKTLDSKLNEAISKKLVDQNDFTTKTDLILQNSASGLIELLRRWPDQRKRLYCCFNQALPPSLRKEAWRLHLMDSKVNEIYTEKVKESPMETISPHDLMITEKCEALLNSSRLFNDLSKNPFLVKVMKTALSYRDAVQELESYHYYLIVPLIFTYADEINLCEGASLEVIAQIVERFFMLLESRRPYMIKEANRTLYQTSRSVFAASIMSTLEKKDFELYKHIHPILKKEGEEEDPPLSPSASLFKILEPFIKQLFTGYFQMDVVCYIWDQYLLGLKEQEYDFILYACISLLVILRNALLLSQRRIAIEHCINENCSKLQVRQFQRAVCGLFGAEVTGIFKYEENLTVPIVLDPLVSNDMIPKWTTWKDGSNSEREENFRKIRKRKQAEEMKRLHEIERKRLEAEKDRLNAEEQSRLQQLEEEKTNQEAEEKRRQEEDLAKKKAQMEEKLHHSKLQKEEEEEKKRQERILLSQEEANKKLVEEQKKLEKLKMQEALKKKAEEDKQAEEKEARKKDRAKQVEVLLLMLVQNFMQSVELLGHGTREEQKQLAESDRKDVEQYKSDIIQAQKILFKRQLTLTEWEKYSKEQRKNLITKMEAVVLKIREKREGVSK